MKHKVAIIGKGNVGIHLYRALSEIENISVELVDSHAPVLNELPDLIILAVKDSCIESVGQNVASLLPEDYQGIIVHTAGSVNMDILQSTGYSHGVIYPLQTFSKNDDNLNYRDIPFFIEGVDKKTESFLTNFVRIISDHVAVLKSEDRKLLHISAVIVCNFQNALYCVAEKLLQQSGLPFRLLLPLIRQTVQKLDNLSPAEAQTGPAARGDVMIIDEHLASLSNYKNEKEIYRLLSQYIMNSNEQD